MIYHSDEIPLDIGFSLTGLLPMHCVYWNFDFKSVLPWYKVSKGAKIRNRRIDLLFGICHKILKRFVDGVMNWFSLHIEPPLYIDIYHAKKQTENTPRSWSYLPLKTLFYFISQCTSVSYLESNLCNLATATLHLYSQETDILMKVNMKFVNIKLLDLLACFHYILIDR